MITQTNEQQQLLAGFVPGSKGRLRLHVLSDLHLEFGHLDIPNTDADIVILAGDIGRGGKGVEWIRRQFGNQPVVYVLGNHEFYYQSLPELTERLKQKTAGTSVYLLENGTVEINEFTILGCTLWTSFMVAPDPRAAMQTAELSMNDYCLVEYGPEQRVLRAQDTVRLHRESVTWLKEELRRHDPERTIVVTHHAPSFRSEAPCHVNSPLSPAFASDLDSLIRQSHVPLWFHGHTHYNVDYQLGITRVLSNQRGYPSEPCEHFDPGMVVEI